ncbi:Docking protein 1 [Merluccius polli]|uniref:Docking protein 1 n=1 Tax=Merluccius polli TaxID=89951 RepID=A0AA47NW12_MERPO|nr:Docking protein 1 [Merluccius polli]
MAFWTVRKRKLQKGEVVQQERKNKPKQVRGVGEVQVALNLASGGSAGFRGGSGMDAHVKDGQLYVQHQKFGKKWKKNWFVLYPASQNGIARLECYDSSSGGGGGAGAGGNEKTRKLDKKIIRLSECISILPAVTETCPKDNMAAFCVETNDKTHVFAAERHVSMEWVEKMCEIAFQSGSGSATSSGAALDSNGGQKELQMSENLIYSSREEVNEFWVSVQHTQASDRCGLTGPYWLKAEQEALVLKDPKTKRGVLLWPYKLLRRYGRDRVMFSFEAGRRCESGPGKFTFDTKQGNDIFQLVEQAIQSQKALVEERIPGTGPGPSPAQDLDGPPLLLWAPADGSNSRESDGDSGGSKPGSADGVLGRRDGGDGGVAKAGGGNKGRCLPEPPPIRVPMGHRHGAAGGGKGTAVPPPLPAAAVAAAAAAVAAAAAATTTTSSSSSSSTSLDDHTSLYSEPADSLRLLPPPPRADGLYSDPVDILIGQSPTTAPTHPPRLRPVGDEGPAAPGDLYSYLYNQTDQELSHKAGGLALDNCGVRAAGGGGGGGGGWGSNGNKRPPGGRAEGSSSSSSSSSSHPMAEHIYDEPEGRAQGSRGQPSEPTGNIYDLACPEPRGRWRAEDDGGSSQWPKAPSCPKPPRHKPCLAPKPPYLTDTSWKEPLPLPPLKPRDAFQGKNANNNNSSGGGGGGGCSSGGGCGGGGGSDGGSSSSIWAGGASSDLYSKVTKQRPPSPGLWFSPHTTPQHHNHHHHHNHRPPLRSPDLIYDNLGDV